jgi:hypothetical protein
MAQLKPYEPGRDPNTGYVTRDGRKVRILATDIRGARVILAAIDDGGYESIYTYFPGGRINITGDYPLDLMCTPERRTVWVNVFKTNRLGTWFGPPRPSRCEAEADFMTSCYVPNSRIACVEVTYTEGEGL